MKKILWILTMFVAFTSMAFAAVNLNTATKEELDAVKGIGPVKAQAIIDYRTQNGPFSSVDDLKKVRGFGDKTVAKMRGDLSVSGATTLPAAKEKAAKAAPAMESKATTMQNTAVQGSQAVAAKADAAKSTAKEDAAAAKAQAKADKAAAKAKAKADKKAASDAAKADKAARKAKAKADKEAAAAAKAQ